MESVLVHLWSKQQALAAVTPEPRSCRAQALSIGSRRQLAVTVRKCSLCNGKLTDFSGVGGAPADGAGERAALGGDATVRLSCKHCFHDQARLSGRDPASAE